MKMQTEENKFQMRAYGWQELALLYNPHVAPNTASKRLTEWVRRNPHLSEELKKAGWQKGYRVLAPIQVEVLTRYLGEP